MKALFIIQDACVAIAYLASMAFLIFRPKQLKLSERSERVFVFCTSVMVILGSIYFIGGTMLLTVER